MSTYPSRHHTLRAKGPYFRAARLTRDRAHACELKNGPAAMLGTSSVICNACFGSCDHRFFSPITSTYSICQVYYLCAYC